MNSAASNNRWFAYLTVVFLSVCCEAYLLLYFQTVETGRAVIFGDIGPFLQTIQFLANHLVDAIYDPANARDLAEAQANKIPVIFPYPPVMLLLLYIFTGLGRFSIIPCWLLMQLMVWILMIIALPRAELLPHFRKPVIYYFMMAGISLPFMVIFIAAGQISLLTSALFLLSLTQLWNRPKVAGICAGLLIIKPHIALILPLIYLAGRHYQALLYAAMTVFSLIVLSILCWGIHPWLDWATIVSIPSDILLTASPHAITIKLLATVFGAFRQLGMSNQMAGALQALSTVIGTVMVFVVSRSRADNGLKVAFYTAAFFVVTPYIYIYDLLPLVFPLAFLAQRAIGSRIAWHEKLLFVWGCFMPIMTLVMPFTINLPIPQLFTALLLIALYHYSMQSKEI